MKQKCRRGRVACDGSREGMGRFDLILLFLLFRQSESNLTERDETGGVSSSNTGASVSDGGVGNGELSDVVTDHLSLNFDGNEGLSVVASNDGADHLGGDGDVTEVSLDGSGALSGIGVDTDLGGAELAHQIDLRLLESTVNLSADTSRVELEKLLGRHLHQVADLYSTVGEGAERSLLGRVSFNFLGHTVSYSRNFTSISIYANQNNSFMSVHAPTVSSTARIFDFFFSRISFPLLSSSMRLSPLFSPPIPSIISSTVHLAGIGFDLSTQRAITAKTQIPVCCSLLAAPMRLSPLFHVP